MQWVQNRRVCFDRHVLPGAHYTNTQWYMHGLHILMTLELFRSCWFRPIFTVYWEHAVYSMILSRNKLSSFIVAFLLHTYTNLLLLNITNCLANHLKNIYWLNRSSLKNINGCTCFKHFFSIHVSCPCDLSQWLNQQIFFKSYKTPPQNKNRLETYSSKMLSIMNWKLIWTEDLIVSLEFRQRCSLTDLFWEVML